MVEEYTLSQLTHLAWLVKCIFFEEALEEYILQFVERNDNRDESTAETVLNSDLPLEVIGSLKTNSLKDF